MSVEEHKKAVADFQREVNEYIKGREGIRLPLGQSRGKRDNSRRHMDFGFGVLTGMLIMSVLFLMLI